VKDHLPSVLVATLSSAFGVALLSVTGVLAQAIRSDDRTGGSAMVAIMLTVLAIVFLSIAIYVGAVVTANTFATIVAGRRRSIALLRLIGASAASERRRVANGGLIVGVAGAVLGAIVGVGLTAVLTSVGVAHGLLPRIDYSVAEPVLLLPVIAVVLTTWLASWVGARRVLTVSPMEATGAAVEPAMTELDSRGGRSRAALVFVIVGFALLVLGVLLGLLNPAAVLIGVIGGLLSFTGVVLGAHRVMPVALRATGRLFGSSAPARLAAENAVRYPERSSRTTIGLVIAVTLITMFSVATESYKFIISEAQRAQPELYRGMDELLTSTVSIFSVLIGFSALIAAVGMVNNLSLSILQRSRELGLLRALGFTVGQVRAMVLAESAQLSIASLLVGLLLGTFYGWAGAQSLFGSIYGAPGLVLPAIPLLLIGVLVAASALLIAVSSIAPARRATRVSPVAALAVD
jgi:putative ABC transport system permease protein